MSPAGDWVALRPRPEATSWDMRPLQLRGPALATTADSGPSKARVISATSFINFKSQQRRATTFFAERRRRGTDAVAAASSVEPLQHRDEEAVGAVAQGSHQQRLGGAVGRRHGRASLASARSQSSGQGMSLKSGWPREEGIDLVAVLRRQHRAGDIGEPAAGLDQVRALIEHRAAARRSRASSICGRKPPFGVGAPPPDARSRSRAHRSARGPSARRAWPRPRGRPAGSTWTFLTPARFSRSKIGRSRMRSES